MIKKYWVYVLFVFSVIVFFITENRGKTKQIEVKAFTTGNGWGYAIYTSNKLYIKQNTIPGVDGNKTFVNENQALQVGNLAVYKINQHKGMPTITIKELDSLGINR